MPEDNSAVTQTNPTAPVSSDQTNPVDPSAGVTSDAPVPEPILDQPAASSDPTPPVMPDPIPAPTPDTTTDSAPVDAPINQTLIDVATKISESQNILIALSSDPSVDELSAAIGLSLYLDKLGKRATAIYSGGTPNALEFLNPEETFESSADALQDFVVALSKEKADHLRYKLDGDYVKVYITPYRTRITEDDLEFSYGDFNVDLVLALDVANGIDLDAALREHGRIMHDAVVINITTGNPGKFGEIEWSDKKASSVSEMIANLLYSVKSDIEVGKEEATAFLTGIVAATNRFSDANTTPETMQIASHLMESGANQQLISKNITSDIDNEMLSLLGTSTPKDTDPTKLDIAHEEDGESSSDDKDEISATITEKDSSLLDDLKAAEASLAQAGSETTPDLSNAPIRLDGTPTPELPPVSVPEPSSVSASEEPTPAEDFTVPSPSFINPEPAMTTPDNTIEADLESPSDSAISSNPLEKTLQPSGDLSSGSVEDPEKYGKMLEDALAGIGANTTEPEAPIISNPAEAFAPNVPSTPEINGVPEINYGTNEAVLPPPPAPPIDINSAMTPDMGGLESAVLPSTAQITPEDAAPAPSSSFLGPQPAMQDQVYAPQASDPGAFKIPGA